MPKNSRSKNKSMTNRNLLFSHPNDTEYNNTFLPESEARQRSAGAFIAGGFCSLFGAMLGPAIDRLFHYLLMNPYQLLRDNMSLVLVSE